MPQKLFRVFPTWLVVAVFLTACSAAADTAESQLPPTLAIPTAEAQANPTNTVVSEAIAVVPTLTPLPSATKVPASPTKKPTNTPEPTATETATPLPTNTPLPTATPRPSPTGTPTPNARGEIVHIVQPGETLDTIVAQYGVLKSQLTTYNGITAAQVVPGAQIRIPIGMMGQTYTGGGGNTAPTAVAVTTADRVVLDGFTFDWQKLNNCGPTTTSVMLSYYGISKPQLTIAGVVKPNAKDKNVSPPEVAAYVRSQGMGAFIGVNGDMALIERLIAARFPVMVEQWMAYDGGVGHYRTVRGFDRTQQTVLQEDTFLGPDIWRGYNEFSADWAAFGGTYIVFYPTNREGELAAAIGNDWNRGAMWNRAYEGFANRGGAYAQYWAGEALHQLGNDQAAIGYYDAAIASGGLPSRFFWYNFGYMEALNNSGQYQRVLDFTAPVLQAMELSEDIRYQRAVAYKALGLTEEARRELNLALSDHPGFAPAQALLNTLPAATPPTATAEPLPPTPDPNVPPTVDPNIPPTVDPNVPTPDPNIPPTVDPNIPPTVDPNIPPTVDPNIPPTEDPNIPTPDPNATPTG